MSGRITALDLDGIVTVQAKAARKRKVHLDDPANITAGGFILGEEVNLLLEVIEPKDQVGLGGREHLRFIQHMTQDELSFLDDNSQEQ